jgi:hypothetical protein
MVDFYYFYGVKTAEGSRIYADTLIQYAKKPFLNVGAAVISLQCIFWPNCVASFIIGLNSTKFGMQTQLEVPHGFRF